MALDLKPLTDEVIEQMGWSSHDLWLVKFNGEIFGPFEVESLKHYATENEPMFEKAFGTRMDVPNWQPFFTHPEFHLIAEAAHPEGKVEEKYWILNMGQKAGPLSRRDIDKKFELGILSIADLVSLDNGETWQKFFKLDAFNTHSGSTDELPMAPLESSFQRAKEEINEWMDTHETTGSHAGLAGLAFMAKNKDKPAVNLDEMDLKSLEETEVSRSLKWAIPSAVAGIGVLAVVGNFILSPSSGEMNEVADAKAEKSEVIMPQNNPGAVGAIPADTSFQRPMPRHPASIHNNRSDLTRRPVHAEIYQPHREEPSYHDDPPMDQPDSHQILPPPDQTMEHSLVSNQVPEAGESLDGAMSGGDPMPEQPVIEEASDF